MPRRQQDRARDAAQKQHWRNVGSVDPYSEVQAQLGAVTGFERSDDFSARDDIASGQRRKNGFIAREDAARVRDRQHVLVHDKPGEVHDAICRCVHRAGRRDIDASMAGRIRRRRRDKRAQDLVRPAHRPGPARLRRGRGRDRPRGRDRAEDGEHQPDEKREAKHPPIVRNEGTVRPRSVSRGAKLPRNAAGGGAVLLFSEHPEQSG
jgi:hypothetical protein